MKCASFLLSSLLLGTFLLPQTTQVLLGRGADSDGIPRHFLRGTPEEEDAIDSEPKMRTRREYMPLSIDLTFHILRNLIHNARIKEQEQLRVHLNRKMLDEMGK